MSPWVERVVTNAITAMVTGALGYYGLVVPVQGQAKGSSIAQDQCCPIARTLAENYGR